MGSPDERGKGYQCPRAELDTECARQCEAAAAAIAAAFGAPLAGAFYAFEIVIRAYTPASIAPVAAATISAVISA
jgi:hypothetical protein